MFSEHALDFIYRGTLLLTQLLEHARDWAPREAARDDQIEVLEVRAHIDRESVH